jgi:hypothetical protein
MKLTPCSRVLPDKLMASQLIMKFSAFYGTRRFMCVHKSRPLDPILSDLNPVPIFFTNTNSKENSNRTIYTFQFQVKSGNKGYFA